ncbi:pyruvate dehydrogenase protein X component-like [Watersipora subatra]|uniref:pyruvate dehydrogenase protein X component-like n=1 Tax=Watersipora subatra TaxID=2589382 RepID=UPI00355B07AC
MANARAFVTVLKSNLTFYQRCPRRFRILQNSLIDDNCATHYSTSALKLKSEISRSVGPSVRLLLTLYDIDPASVTASGPHHRLLKGDVLQHIADNKLEPKPFQALARQVTTDVVKKDLAVADVVTKSISSPTAPPLVLDDIEYIDSEITSMRKAIAQRVSQSKLNVPHLYASTECLMVKLKDLQQSLAEHGIQVSINDFIIKACATALQRMPNINCSWIEGEIIALNSVDISVAMATDSGLLMPVVPEANTKSLEEISRITKELGLHAEDGTLQSSKMSSGSLTVSNLGMYGVKEFTAVIDPPQATILSVGCEQASLHEGSIVPVLNFSLTYDGRAIEADQAVQFLSVVKRLLENPIEMGL